MNSTVQSCSVYFYLDFVLFLTLYTVSHNYGNPYEKWNIFVARPHLWLQLGMVKLEIILCETVLNLSTLNALTFLHTNILTSRVSRSLMVSVGVSALGTTSIHFIEPGIKVNSQYYREDLPMQKLLPDICQLSDVFQQDSAPAHSARETIELLTMETPEFIPPVLATKQSGFKSGRIKCGP